MLGKMPEHRITSGYTIRGLTLSSGPPVDVAVVLTNIQPADEPDALSEMEGVAEIVLYKRNDAFRHAALRAAQRAVSSFSIIEVAVVAARAAANCLERFGSAEVSPDHLARFLAAYLQYTVPPGLGEGSATAHQKGDTFFLCLPAGSPETLLAKCSLLMALCLHCTGAPMNLVLDVEPQAPTDRRWAVRYAPPHRAADLPDHVLLKNHMLARVEPAA